KVDQVKIGDRAAINLVGIEKESIKRGHVLAEPDFFKPTRFLDAKLYLLKDASKALKHNTRVRLHLGTSELMARTALLDKQELVPGDAAFVQFRLEQPVATDVGDRFVIRSYSPVRTIGGGLILQVHPRRHKRFSEEVIQYLATIEEGNTLKIMEQTLLKAGSVPMSLEELTANTSLPPTTIQNSLAELIKAQKVISIEDKAQPGYLHVNRYQTIKNGILTVLEQFHKQNPLRKGLSRTELKTALKESVPLSLFNKAIAELETEKKIETLADRLSLISHQLVLTSEQEALKSEIEQWYLTHRFTPPNTAEVIEQFKGRHAEVEEMIAVLMEDGLLVKLEEGMLMHRHWIDEARNMILHHFQKQEELTISDFRQMVNSSRKYAVPLLGYFDQEGLTIRQQDVRVLNPKSETLLRELKP
ncbi:MAG: SelB C-terminal domain-containing protein, partial [candidate division KSB1 bacterium]|nr:SelB C-terminal domain-containing protein [candidate division KSB1 bacterium]